jgi:hypothetical protein
MVKTSCRNDQLTEPKFVSTAADLPGFAGFPDFEQFPG